VLLHVSSSHLPNHLAQVRAMLEKAGQTPGSAPVRVEAINEPGDESEAQVQKWYEM
jgi:hypothetical protein